MKLKLSAIEKEAIVIKAVQELIDSIINFEVISLYGKGPDSNIKFRSITHQKYFNIILGELLSSTAQKSPIGQISYLDELKSICDNPNFNVKNSIAPLRKATEKILDWLDKMIEVDVWLPSIKIDTKLKIKRREFLEMCGNISKHHFLKLDRVANKLIEALRKNNISIDFNDALLALGDFYERFHTDIFAYHSSTIAEFLNNIRWGIYFYLQPEYHRSIVLEEGDPPRYHYTYPEGVKTKISKECYWEIMNVVRNQPYVRRFQVTQHLKLRY